VLIDNVKMITNEGKNDAGGSSSNTAKAWFTGEQGTGRIDLGICLRYGENRCSSMFKK